MVTLKNIRMRKSTLGLLLAGCLISAPALSQEIIKWVDEEGVTHFGHPATASHKMVQANPQVSAEPAMTEEAHDATKSAVALVAATNEQNGVRQSTRKIHRTP